MTMATGSKTVGGRNKKRPSFMANKRRQIKANGKK